MRRGQDSERCALNAQVASIRIDHFKRMADAALAGLQREHKAFCVAVEAHERSLIKEYRQDPSRGVDRLHQAYTFRHTEYTDVWTLLGDLWRWLFARDSVDTLLSTHRWAQP